MVIGAGAAGCLAAIKAAESGASVALLERNSKIGRKIMLTGKGRCNLTNAKPWVQFCTHLHGKPAFFKPAFYGFSNENTVSFFNAIGVQTVLTRDDRVFPETMTASTVVDALARRISQLQIKTLFSCTVTGVKRTASGSFETSFTDGKPVKFQPGLVCSRSVVVATGGLSYPSTGSTGTGYDIARSFGHTVDKTFPSLTALTPAGYDFRLNGICLINVSAQLFVGKDMVAFEFGDVQFTDGGIEGPVGFRISRKAVWALLCGDKVSVSIDLKPAVALPMLRERVARLAGEAGIDSFNFQRKRVVLLRKFMPRELVEPFVSANNPTLDNLAETLKNWRFNIVDYVGYRRAVVTAGGVNLDEVVSKTMSSRHIQGLFFAGEVLDMDGDTGGYNLQFAFSTGALAGRSAAEYAARVQ